MRKKNQTPSKKRKAGQRAGIGVKQSLALKAIYLCIGIVFCVNLVFLLSLVERMHYAPATLEKKPNHPVSHPGEAETAIKVEVLNGAGVSGIARQMTDYLRQKGFDVINYGNAESFSFYTTIVLDRIGHRSRAQQVARAIGTETVVEQKNTYLALDVTMILGRDFKTLLPFSGKGGYDDR